MWVCLWETTAGCTFSRAASDVSSERRTKASSLLLLHISRVLSLWLFYWTFKGKGISQSHSLTETGQVLFGDKLLALNYNIPHLLTSILLRSWNSIESLDFGSLQHFESFLFLSFCLRFAAVVENLNYWVLLIESKVRQKNNSDTTWTSETNLSLNFFK